MDKDNQTMVSLIDVMVSNMVNEMTDRLHRTVMSMHVDGIVTSDPFPHPDGSGKTLRLDLGSVELWALEVLSVRSAKVFSQTLGAYAYASLHSADEQELHNAASSRMQKFLNFVEDMLPKAYASTFSEIQQKREEKYPN